MFSARLSQTLCPKETRWLITNAQLKMTLIHKRHADGVLRGPNAEINSDTRTTRAVGRRIADAFFNHSMWLYLLLIALDIVLWCCFGTGQSNEFAHICFIHVP